ncbi:MAG: hypothetical protein ABI743_01955 [bacterium]
MRRIMLTTALVMSAALFGCSGGSTQSPVNTPANIAPTGGNSLDQLKADVDATALAPSGYVEIVDAETGALVSRSDLTINSDGSLGTDLRDGQDVAYGPVANRSFSVALTIDTDAPNAPRGYTGSGNPIYYVGDTVIYDLQVTRLRRRRPARYQNINAAFRMFDVEVRHEFAADDSLIPECVAGQNPLTIQDVDYRNHTPNGGPYAWSPDGKTFAATGLPFVLCNLPGMQYGTDQICVRIYWVVPGTAFGLPCSTCEVRCIVFDKCIGIYDP